MSDFSGDRISRSGVRAAPSQARQPDYETPDVRYSLVIPVFNEEAVLPVLLPQLDDLLSKLDGPAELIFVDDGSRDAGLDFLRWHAHRDPRYRIVELSRNFGHQAAITAGMDYSRGAAVIIMDADLQDPPPVVLEMIAKWQEGYDIVYAKRAARESESRFKRATAWLFYRLLRKLTEIEIPEDVGDFRLVDRSAVASFRNMRERDRFVRGMFAWMGYRQASITFVRAERAAGRTKYGFGKMLRLALDGIFGFSDVPLRMILWIGITVSAMAMAYGLYAIALKLSQDHVTAGWASTITTIAFLSGVNMVMTGVIGLYVGRIHREVKARPLYLVRDTFGFRSSEPPRESVRPHEAVLERL